MKKTTFAGASALAWLLFTTAPSNADADNTRSTTSKTSNGLTHIRPGLDTGAVRKLYLDGDFEEAIKLLEAALKTRGPFSHGDSILIFKHLGVMYAANYETREKGKYFMHQLLTVEPTARIMDMYASDMIYMIFKNIQDEFESSRMRFERAESHLVGNGRSGQEPKHTDTSGSREARVSKRSRATAYWLGATGVALAAGVGAYLYIANQPGETVTINHPVSK